MVNFLRNKIFAIVFSVIFLFMFIGAPLSIVLTKYGILEYNNIGNEIKPDKVYNNEQVLGNFFNKVEKGKMEIKDTYINNLPFFLDITESYKPLKSSVNQPVNNWLQTKGNDNTVFVCPHVYEEETTEPTCTEDGKILYTCRLCKESYVEVIPKLEHKYESEVVKPTCTDKGYTYNTCSVCSYGIQTDLVDTLPHEYVDGVCTVCGKAEFDIEPTVPDTPDNSDTPDEPVEEHDHVYEKTVTAPTCTEMGYDLYSCTLCSDSYIENKVASTGHKYSPVVTAPTCTEKGYTTKTCTQCNDTQVTDTVPARGHNYTVKTVAPTYTEEGYDLHTCSYCKDSFKDNTVPMLVNIIPEPKTTPDAEGTTYTASLKTTDSIFRHYAITATAPDGSSKTTYARIVKLDREVMRESMLRIVDMVNKMVEIDRNVNWYFSFATNIEATEIGTKIMPHETTRHIYEEFLVKLDKSVKTSALVVNSFNDYYDKFYITDHHWNHHGSEEAYMGIVKMLRENYPDIVPIELEQLYEFEDVKFFGSLANAHANRSVWDTFGVYYRSLPSHTLKRDEDIGYGSSKTLSANLNTYKNGEFSTASGYNHYTQFYRIPKKVSYGDNNTGRNLLIIGDSYSLPLLELVAAHFDKTYVRYEDRNWNNFPEELFYDEFIAENDITDVIVIEEMAKSIMEGYGSAYPSGFLEIYPNKAYLEGN